MAFLFGSGYDSLANSRLAYDQLNMQTAERDRAARDAAAQSQAQQQIEVNRQAQENARLQSQQYYQSIQDAQRQANTDAATKTANYQFNVGESDRTAAEKERQAEQTGKTVSGERTLGGQQFDFSQNQNKLNALLTGINAGEVNDPSEIDQHPDLNSDQKAQAKAAWTIKNNRDKQFYQAAESQATALNAAVVAARKSKALPGVSQDDTELTAEEADAIAAKVKGNKQMVKFDEDSQMYVPNADTPHGYDPQTRNTAPTAIPAPVTPPSTMQNMWQGFKRNAPTIAPYAAAAANPVGAAVGAAGNYLFGAGQQPSAPPVAPQLAPITGASAVPTQSGMVKIKTADGKTGLIPAANLPAALARGATQIQ